MLRTTSIGTDTSTIEPFKISVPDSQLETLQRKLELATFPDELDHRDGDENKNEDAAADWSMGAPLSHIRRLTAYWRESFDWRKTERKLNERLPQFLTNVQVAGFGELQIHFVYQKSVAKSKKAVPLLFLHGCKSVIP
jgi:hypothetical protein